MTPKKLENADAASLTGQNAALSKADTAVGLRAANSDRLDLADRVQLLADRAGLGRQEFADVLGVKLRTLNSQLSRGMLETDVALPMASHSGVSLDWLLLGSGPMHRGEVEIIQPQRPSRMDVPEGYVLIPRYEARAGAGRGVINPTDRIVEMMIVNEEYIRRRLRRRPEDMTLLEALGDSMSPTIQDGDVMMVDASVMELRGSGIYLVLLDAEELMVKRLHRRPGGAVMIISDNDRYPPEEVLPSERDPLRIMGQVVWYGRPLPG